MTPIVTIGCEYGQHSGCKSRYCECSCHENLPEPTTRTETQWAIMMTQPETEEKLYRNVWVDPTRAARPSRPFTSAEDAQSQVGVYQSRYNPTVVSREVTLIEGPWSPVVTGVCDQHCTENHDHALMRSMEAGS
jgi:hypothetical protein